VRRHDTIVVREAQQAMLAILGEARSARAYRRQLEEVFALARTLLARLRSGKVPAAQLLITNRLSRKPGEYRSRQAVALAARELEARGVTLAPGESIEYILTAGGGARPFEAWTADDRYDVARYGVVRGKQGPAVPGLGQGDISLTGIGQPELLHRVTCHR
jgi:DNA polymerase elongation subunit (family B)